MPDHERIVPWVASIGLHAGLIGLGFVITWTVVSLGDDEPPLLVIADFDALRFDPLEPMQARPEPAESTPTPQEPSEVPVETKLAEQLAALEPPTLSLYTDNAASTSAADFAATPARTTASFVGLTTTNARTIVYVIDASGSMIGSLPIVLTELKRSLETLSDRQSYAVIFFQDNKAVVTPPAGRLQPASADARSRTNDWIRKQVVPRGRSNPLEALRRALSLRPDVIFLLSEDITGSGEFEIDQRDLLSLLDKLNPIDADSGRRRTRINCVQFLDPDPLQTLQRIAEQHGGADGYRLLSRSELGLD
jgi:hypothetical protein